MRHAAIVSLLLLSACTGGDTDLPQDVQIAVESSDGLVPLTDGAQLPVHYGPEGGNLVRLWFGGDIGDACPVEQKLLRCRASYTLALASGEVLVEGIGWLDSLQTAPEPGWPFFLPLFFAPQSAGLQAEELIGRSATLRLELIVDDLHSDAVEIVGSFSDELEF